MTPELTVLALGALWQMFQIKVAGASLNRDVGFSWNAGPRDGEPQLSPRTGRMRRAVNNHFEALALFTIAVVVISLAEKTSGLTAISAWAWLLARIAYFPAYILGWSPWRSAIWAVGALATLVILVVSLI